MSTEPKTGGSPVPSEYKSRHEKEYQERLKKAEEEERESIRVQSALNADFHGVSNLRTLSSENERPLLSPEMGGVEDAGVRVAMRTGYVDRLILDDQPVVSRRIRHFGFIFVLLVFVLMVLLIAFTKTSSV